MILLLPLATLASHLIIISTIPVPLACILGFAVAFSTGYLLTISIQNLIHHGQASH